MIFKERVECFYLLKEEFVMNFLWLKKKKKNGKIKLYLLDQYIKQITTKHLIIVKYCTRRPAAVILWYFSS